jgi:hypothetical protein
VIVLTKKHHFFKFFLFLIHLLSHFRTMSNSPEARRAVEKRVKQSQDVGGSSSKAKKPHARKIILHPPPLVPSDEEEEELHLQIHSPIEHPGSQRTPVNYMREDSRTIIAQWNTPCYDSDKVGPDPHFWSFFHADGTDPSTRASNLQLFLCNGWIGHT